MRTICAALLILASVAGAQAPVPTRSLGPVVATSQPLASVSEVRQLSDGRVLVNDAGSRQLLLFDSLLKTARVALDSAGPPERRYGGRGGRSGTLIPFVGDTTLFFDQTASALLVLDGNASVVRIGAPPTGRGLSNASRVDTRGRLVFNQSGGRSSVSPTDPGMRMTVSLMYLVAFDLARHTVDTVFTMSNDTTYSAAPARGGTPTLSPVVTPVRSLFPPRTEHAVMPDGTIAIVRGEDYHVDWLAADGSITRSARIAHEWKRLTDDDKKRMADSLTVVRDSTNKQRLASLSADPSRPATMLYDAVGRIIGVSIPANVASATGRAAAPRPATPPPPQSLVPIPPDVIPDYLPATVGGLMADADNHLWVPRSPTKPLPPFTRVFDIVDRAGKLIDRVGVDPSITIVGFGRGGNVYLFVRDGGVGRLQKVRFK